MPENEKPWTATHRWPYDQMRKAPQMLGVPEIQQASVPDHTHELKEMSDRIAASERLLKHIFGKHVLLDGRFVDIK